MIKLTFSSVSILFAFLLLTGCITTQMVPMPLTAGTHDLATIVFKRQGSFVGAANSVQIHDGGTHIGELASGGVLQWSRSEGPAEIYIKHHEDIIQRTFFNKPKIFTSHKLIFDVKQANIYNIMYDYNAGSVSLLGSPTIIEFTSSPSGASIYTGLSPESLQLTNMKTPYTMSLQDEKSSWRPAYYKMSLNGYQDSPVVYKNNNIGRRDVHFDLALATNNDSLEKHPAASPSTSAQEKSTSTDYYASCAESELT